MRRVLVGLAALATVAVVVGGNPAGVRADDDAEARRHYRQGEAHLAAERWRDAIASFQAGYAASPRPGFLLNIANSYRKLGELGPARIYFWRFLDAAPKDHPSRSEVIEYLRTIEQIAADGVPLEETRPAAASPPVGTRQPVGDAAVGPGIAPSSSVRDSNGASGLAAAATDLRAKAPAAEPAPPPWQRWWFWTGVGAVAVAGVVTAIVLTRPGGSSCQASLGCLHE